MGPMVLDNRYNPIKREYEQVVCSSEPIYRVEKQMDEEYLGDGVYASFDGYYIWLRVEREGRDEKIALEPSVYHALQNYANTLKEKNHE
jgi:hypothetical protein